MLPGIHLSENIVPSYRTSQLPFSETPDKRITGRSSPEVYRRRTSSSSLLTVQPRSECWRKVRLNRIFLQISLVRPFSVTLSLKKKESRTHEEGISKQEPTHVLIHSANAPRTLPCLALALGPVDLHSRDAVVGG